MDAIVKADLDKFDEVLKAIRKGRWHVEASDRAIVQWFLDVTPSEDVWLSREHNIDSSPAEIMRKFLNERGTASERVAGFDLHLVRQAFRAFVSGHEFPRFLMLAAKVSILNWKLVVEWQAKRSKEARESLAP